MTLKSYAELGHVHRTAPCQEYPGSWLVFYPETLEGLGENYDDGKSSLEEALASARDLINKAEEDKREYNARDISICWKCSDNDPRIGQVWFTPFYQHGRFNIFGDYRSS